MQAFADGGRLFLDADTGRIAQRSTHILLNAIQLRRQIAAILDGFMTSLGHEQAPAGFGPLVGIGHHLARRVHAVVQVGQQVHASASQHEQKNVQAAAALFVAMRVFLLWVALAVIVPLGQAQIPADQLVQHPATIEQELRDIAAVNPEFIRMESFGKSELDFDLWLLDFVHPDRRQTHETPQGMMETVDKHVPVFYLDANHHGNEQLGMEALLLWLHELADWSLTEEGQERLREVRIVAAPMINPDGTGRSNRVNTNFVDLNRNYDYNWGLYGTSDTASPAGGTYRGESPLSELESSANARLMGQLMPVAYLSMHTGSHDIVLPWRNSTDGDGPMPDWPVYEKWLAGIEEVSGLGYRDPSGAGESISHAYGNHGTLSLIVEVDELQTQVIVEDIPDRLKEEVLIYWWTLDNLENLGGYLVQEGDEVCNIGWGPAFSVTQWEDVHDHHLQLLADRIDPGDCVPLAPAVEGWRMVDWLHTEQATLGNVPGPMHRPYMLTDANQHIGAPLSPPDEGAPLPAALLLMALAFAVRRRAA